MTPYQARRGECDRLAGCDFIGLEEDTHRVRRFAGRRNPESRPGDEPYAPSRLFTLTGANATIACEFHERGSGFAARLALVLEKGVPPGAGRCQAGGGFAERPWIAECADLLETGNAGKFGAGRCRQPSYLI